jgi:peptidase M28-like protein
MAGFRRPGSRVVLVVVLALAGTWRAGAAGGLGSITRGELNEWLTYIASDDLQGRAVFGTGIGLAAGYIEDHLKVWGVKPAGDHGSYLQTVRILGVKSTSRSSVTVEVAGESRTFRDGDGITFPKNMGGRQRFTVDRVEFVGYGLDAPAAGHLDYRDKNVNGAAVVWLGPIGPREVDGGAYRRALSGRNRYATEQLGAAAAIGVAASEGGGGRGGRGAGADAANSGGGRRGGTIPAADFTTVQRLDTPAPPNVTAGDPFFEFLFRHAPAPYDELKRKAAAQEPLPSFHLEGVTITFDVEPEYQVVRTQLAYNVVGVVEGADAKLRNTYVAFGAHYDHVGYAEGEVADTDGTPRRIAPPGRVTAGAVADRIWNGADDDGSGTVALMAIARAMAEGARPRRSALFVWHVGEERGLWGSRYFADYPTVPMSQIVAQLNIDMIGRNRDDKTSEANTVYVVGSDRISTELHTINRAANAALPKPLTLDYEFNDPTDLEQLYYRSDHYSYAAKGVPIIFFTPGLHPDYHANTDEVSKIEFDKMTRIVQMVYETGVRVGNLDHAPERDNRGPRAGRHTQ